MFPELEMEIKLYVEERVQSKSYEFRLQELAEFVTKRFIELHGQDPDHGNCQGSSSICPKNKVRIVGGNVQSNSHILPQISL